MTHPIKILEKKAFFLPPVVRPGLTWVTLEDALVLKQILTMGRMWRLAGRHITCTEREIQSWACYGKSPLTGSFVWAVSVDTNGDLWSFCSRETLRKTKTGNDQLSMKYGQKFPWNKKQGKKFRLLVADSWYGRFACELPRPDPINWIRRSTFSGSLHGSPSTAVIKYLRHPNWPTPNFVNLKEAAEPPIRVSCASRWSLLPTNCPPLVLWLNAAH